MLLCEGISYSTERISRKIFCFSRTFFSLPFSLPRRISIFTTAFSRAFFFSLSLSLGRRKRRKKKKKKKKKRKRQKKVHLFRKRKKSV